MTTATKTRADALLPGNVVLHPFDLETYIVSGSMPSSNGMISVFLQKEKSPSFPEISLVAPNEMFTIFQDH